MDDDQPSYVQHGVREVAAYLEEITGRKVPIESGGSRSTDVQLVVGAKSVQQLAPRVWPGIVGRLGAEGFLLRVTVDNGQRRVLVTGATPQGTKYGLLTLLKHIQVAGRSAFIPASLNITSKPSFSVRGMHLNGWAFDYPYTFRCWQERDWQCYIDLLACQGVNLVFIWPFMEIIPLPLSAADRSYLEEVRRVVAYAQKRRGMEVWIFQSPNRVAWNDCGVRDPRFRPYWVTKAQGDYAAAGQVDMNPADPKQFAQIMKSRETLYRIVNNADGYGTIDNDPGGWPKSPLSDFMKIFKASRALLDEVTIHGKQAKQVYWLWYGWGQPGAGRPDWSPRKQHHFMRETIRAMKREVREPWWLIAGQKPYLPACAAEGVLARTVYLPYNVIEAEPSRPGTQHNFRLMREHLDAIGRYPGTAGLMGNVQTALLQFPHTHYFLGAAWDHGYRQRTPREALGDLAAQVYPEQQELLVDCWMAMAPAGRAHAGQLARRLERLVKADRLGRPGILGRRLFPDRRQIARDLVWQLKAWAAFEALRRAAGQRGAPEPCARSIETFLAAALKWDRQHGWSAYWRKLGHPWELLPVYDTAYPQVIANVKKILDGATADEAAITTFLAPIRRRLQRRFDAWIVDHCAIEPLKKALVEPQPASV